MSEYGIQLVIKHVDKLFLTEGMNGGTLQVGDKIIKDSFNDSSFTGNVSVQSDGAIQNQNTGEFGKEFNTLVSEIKQIKEESARESAKYLADDLKEAYSKQDKDKAAKIFGVLTTILGASSSLANLAKFFGLSL